MKILKDIGRYKLIKEISNTEENNEYLGVDDKNDKLVTVKVISKSYLQKTKGLSKLKKQIEIFNKLKHENIIRLKDLPKTPNNIYFVTEYCNGGKLGDFFRFYKEEKKSQFNEIYIQKIIKQVCCGIEYMHSQNVIHRGINLDSIGINFNKYQNVVLKGKVPPLVNYSQITLDDSFTVKIQNMEFAKDLKEETSANTIIGKASDMAPDMIFNNSYNNKIDLWALGVMTYELLTGEKPFTGDDNQDIYNKIKQGKYNIPKTLIASYEIITFMNGLLQFYPEKRMDWPQIKTHPFLINNVNTFHFIELNAVEGIEQNEIELNSKKCDNLLWILYKGKNTNFDLDKMNIKLNEKEKEEINKHLDDNKVNNEAIQKASEEKKVNFQNERKRLKNEIIEADKLKKEVEDKMKEVNLKNDEKDQLLLKVKELEEQLKNNNNQDIKNQIKNYNNKINQINEFAESIDKLLANAQKKKISAQKGLISIKIQEIFSEDQISTLKNEKDVIKFFLANENEFKRYFFMNYKNDELLREFSIKEIENIFKNNSYISEITKNIYSKLESIPLDKIDSEEELNEKIFNIFNDIILPKFLTDKYLKTLNNKTFTQKRNKYMTKIISNVIQRNYTQKTQSLVEFYDNIKENKMKVFDTINNKNLLFDLFVIVNIKTFQRTYFDSTFSSFLKNNEALIKDNFGDNTKYVELLEINDDDQINNKKEELFKIIKKDLNLDKVYIIIASFYNLLFYKFKDVKEIKGRNNIGNVYINVIVKNFVLFLSQNLDNLKKNLISLLNQLRCFDFNIYKESKEDQLTNKTYSFDEINAIMLQCGTNLKTKYEYDLKEYETIIDSNVGLFTAIGDRIYDRNKFKNIKLIALDENVFSNTITIIIDMCSNEDKEDKRNIWNKFIEYFDKVTMIYFFQFSNISKSELLQNGTFQKMKKIKGSIVQNKALSKSCGKLLADYLISNKFFNNYLINIVGFGQGANVIKFCLKDLSKLNGKKNYIKFKNVILIGGAAHIKKEKNWRKNIENTIIDRFINCYSGKDEVLKYFYNLSFKKGNKANKIPFGLHSLEIKDEKGNNLVTNYDFTDENYNLLSYEPEKIAEKIFEQYKDI